MVAHQAFELERVVEELLFLLTALAQFAQTRLHLQRRLQGEVFPLLGRGVELGDAVENLTFQFKSQQVNDDNKFTVGGKAISIPLVQNGSGPVNSRNSSALNVHEKYTIGLIRGPRRGSAPQAITNVTAGGTTVGARVTATLVGTIVAAAVAATVRATVGAVWALSGSREWPKPSSTRTSAARASAM